jgi:polyisoprenoid-binding protein YceI
VSGCKPRARINIRLCSGLLLLIIGASAERLTAQEMTVELDPANTRIKFTVAATLHTVQGNFALKSGIIHFNPSTGAASGLVVVDATSGNSENKGRDHKMHQEILESQRYPEITFTPARMSGKLELQGHSSVQVDGILRLHGADHPISLTLPVQVQGQNLSAQTHIVIPYVAWGLKNPSTLILHVNENVDIDIDAVGRVSPQAEPPTTDR